MQLGSPLLGTVVEVRDKNGSPVHEGTGQVFLGWLIFVGVLRQGLSLCSPGWFVIGYVEEASLDRTQEIRLLLPPNRP